MATLVDADGKAIFTPADTEALAGQWPKVLKRLSDVALEVNSLKADSVETAAKNS